MNTYYSAQGVKFFTYGVKTKDGKKLFGRFETSGRNVWFPVAELFETNPKGE